MQRQSLHRILSSRMTQNRDLRGREGALDEKKRGEEGAKSVFGPGSSGARGLFGFFVW